MNLIEAIQRDRDEKAAEYAIRWKECEHADALVREAEALLLLAREGEPVPLRQMAAFLAGVDDEMAADCWVRLVSRDPVDQVEPVEPGEPVDQVEPVEPVEPGEPGEPVELFEADDAADAAEPGAEPTQRPIRRADVVQMLRIYAKAKNGLTGPRIIELMAGLDRCAGIILDRRGVEKIAVILASLVKSPSYRHQVRRVSVGRYRWIAQ